ncbi:hypothetical protein G6F46_013898 [Rhizopus delemar]|nr:hypothetical protein G6F46_013898 [Rhizopus delemar]
MVSVTGTENVLMGAVLAEGTTILDNCAMEPEVTDLAHCLIALGAKIEGLGTARLGSEGVERLSGGRHEVLPDRIETGTFLVAAAMTGGKVTVNRARPNTMDAVLSKLVEAGQAAEGGQPDHRAVPGVPDRHAGAVHGAQLRGRRRGRDQ